MIHRYYQWRLERAIDERREPSGAIERHLSHCPDCRAVLERHLRLADRLRSDARGLTERPEADRVADIMTAVSRSNGRKAERRRIRPIWVWLPAATAAAVLAVIVLSPAREAVTPDLESNPLPVATFPAGELVGPWARPAEEGLDRLRGERARLGKDLSALSALLTADRDQLAMAAEAIGARHRLDPGRPAGDLLLAIGSDLREVDPDSDRIGP